MNWFLKLIKDYGSAFIHLLYPNLCEGCHQPLLKGEEVVCLYCTTLISYTNFHLIQDNETVSRFSGRIHFQHATSLAYFTKDSLIQHLIYGLKYHNKKQIGLFLGKEIGKTIKEANWNLEVIIPVPLHPKKEAKRGFNQSELIANGISDVLAIPVFNKHLIRIKNTSSQTDKNRSERIENVYDAFSIYKPELFIGKHILLVDDVLTTGATIEACVNTLLQIPTVKISIATIALASN